MPAKPWVVLPLVLPVADQTYTVQPIDYAGGLELIAVVQGTSETIKSDSPNETLFRLVMGDTWDLMLADGLPFNVMLRAGMAATQYQMALVNDQSTADAVAVGEAMWASGISPEALAAVVAASQSKESPSKGSPRSPGTGSGNRTRTRASTRPTTSPKGTPRAKPKASRSVGTT